VPDLVDLLLLPPIRLDGFATCHQCRKAFPVAARHRCRKPKGRRRG
jgi:hypothetical protein